MEQGELRRKGEDQGSQEGEVLGSASQSGWRRAKKPVVFGKQKGTNEWVRAVDLSMSPQGGGRTPGSHLWHLFG